MSVAIIPDFVKYQIEWLTSHDDLEFEPAIKDAIVQMLQDTGKSFIDEQAVETSQIDHIAESGRMVERTAETAQNVSDSDLVYREAAIEAIAKQMPRSYTPDGSHPADEEIFKAQEIYVDCIESIEILPAVQPDHNADISEINKFIDGLEEILADIRERHVDDSVCGLCEYDGAYMGQSGDWCNECPGFDKDDCFKLSDETRKKWIEEIVNTYPDHTADIGKKVSISCGRENDLISRQEALKELAAYIHLIDKTMGKGTLTDDDCMEAAESVLGEDELPAVQPETNCSEIPNGSDDTISRQAAIDALARMMPRSYTPDGSHPADEEIFRAQEVFADCIEALEILPSAQPGWIPVTEQLPDVRQWVLCQCRAGIMDVLRLTADGSWSKNYPHTEYMSSFVVAWMPIPAPWEGDANG